MLAKYSNLEVFFIDFFRQFGSIANLSLSHPPEVLGVLEEYKVTTLNISITPRSSKGGNVQKKLFCVFKHTHIYSRYLFIL